MAINFLNSVDLNTSQLLNAVIQNVGTDPSSVLKGQIIYRTDTNQLKVANGSSYVQVGGSFTLRAADSASGSNDFTVTPGSTVSLAGGTNMTVTRGGSGSENVFTVNTSATPDQTVTLSGAVTGTGTTAITTVLQQVVDTSKFVASAITKSDEDFANIGSGTSGDSQLPTTKSVYNYVNLVATGNLKFMGGFNAATGAITSGPNSGGNITEDIAIAVGDYYVVTVLGNFYGTTSPAPNPAIPLTPGDNVIGTTARSAGATLSASDWSVVQADRDVATATTIGAGNTESSSTSGIDVAYTSPSDGTATLSLDVNSVTASTDKPSKVLGTDSSGNTRAFTNAEFFEDRFLKLVLNNGDSSGGIQRTYDSSTGITDFELDFSNFMGGVSAENLSIEIVRNSGDRDTVYAQLKRSGDILNVYFSGAEVANSAMLLLLTNVA